MKILSLCFDMGIGYQTTLPSFDQYLGYIFCPANLIFGPWIPFDVYCRLFEGQTQVMRDFMQQQCQEGYFMENDKMILFWDAKKVLNVVII